MVKLALTVAAVITAAALLVDVGASQPDSPHHKLFLRQARPTGSSVGVDPADSGTERPPPCDSSSSVDRDYAGSFRAVHHPPPPDVGSLGGALDAGHEDGSLRHGSGSLSNRFPPLPDVGSSGPPSPPDTDKDDMAPFTDCNQGGIHRKALQNAFPESQNSSSQKPYRPTDGPNHGGQENQHPSNDMPNRGHPPSENRNSSDDNSPNRDSNPAGGSKPLRGDKPMSGHPPDENQVDGPLEPSSESGDRDKSPDGRDGEDRAHVDRPSWYGSGSADGRFPPPPDAGSDEQQPVAGGDRELIASTNAGKPGDGNPPLSRAGSGSQSPMHDVVVGTGEVPAEREGN
ncbi:hypothetical protein PF004_g26813 [Phytophthora fragariae]|uniref:RxLR effector protein n=2 Tax=Phytophthora fragariae TaxID=53985 RepID=A0A6G0MN59_9STRA|nr:hypothetical protein PF004_g26813 [Phytophthora fragariae]